MEFIDWLFILFLVVISLAFSSVMRQQRFLKKQKLLIEYIKNRLVFEGESKEFRSEK